MAFLPPVPDSKRIPTELFDYLVALVRELGEELDSRPVIQGGVLYLGGDRPVHLISPNGSLYELSVDNDGNLVTTLVTS